MTLLIFFYLVNTNVNYYYQIYSPYMEEISNHSMAIMRNADLSTGSLERVMQTTQELSLESMPEIVHNTTAIMSRMAAMATKPPSISISLVQ